MASRVFGTKQPLRPQYGSRQEGGVVAEIADLRRDTDEAFSALEALIGQGQSNGQTTDLEREQVGKLRFTWETQPYSILQQLFAGQVISGVAVIIDEAFDDPAAAMRLGTSSNPECFLGAADSELGSAGQYTSEQYAVIRHDDTFIMSISPGTSTQGTGYLLYRVR